MTDLNDEVRHRARRLFGLDEVNENVYPSMKDVERELKEAMVVAMEEFHKKIKESCLTDDIQKCLDVCLEVLIEEVKK